MKINKTCETVIQIKWEKKCIDLYKMWIKVYLTMPKVYFYAFDNNSMIIYSRNFVSSYDVWFAMVSSSGCSWIMVSYSSMS